MIIKLYIPNKNDNIVYYEHNCIYDVIIKVL